MNPERRMFSWTQPQCRACFKHMNPDRNPVVLLVADEELCVTCSRPTLDGIYVRIDPMLAPNPTILKEG